MTVSNGELANEGTFNNSFMSREADTSTTGVVQLLNALSASGASVANVQRFINSVASTLGISTSQVYNFLFTWAADYVGAPNDTVKARIDAIVALFHGTTGHAHTGADGDGKQIAASNLTGLNYYRAAFQSLNLTSVSGTTFDATAAFSGASKLSGGTATTTGVVTTAPYNKLIVISTSTQTFVEDGAGQRVYGRVTYSAGTWTLSFYTNEAGTETPHNLSSQDITIFFQEVFTLASLPTIQPTMSEFGTLDVSADVVDATATQRGLISAAAQSIGGAKTFVAELNVGAFLDLNSQVDSSLTGSNAQLVPTKTLTIVTNALLASINRISATDDGRVIGVLNATGAALSFIANSGSPSSEQISMASNLTIEDGQLVFFVYDSNSSKWKRLQTDAIQNVGTFQTSSTANGLSILANVLRLHAADGTNPGALTAAAQTVGGVKTFAALPIFSEGVDVRKQLFGVGSTDSSSTGAGAALTAPASLLLRLTNGSLSSIASISAPAALQAFMLANLTGNTVTLTNSDSGATSVLTGTGSDISVANNAVLFLVYDFTSSRWRVVGGTGSGSSSGISATNLVPEGDAETSNPFTAYADSGSRPTDMTGGSPTVSTSITSTTPVLGTKSFLLTKTAANSQGQGWAVTKTVPLGMRGKPLFVKFKVVLNSGTFAGSSVPTTDSDVILYAYDVTNGVLHELAPKNLEGMIAGKSYDWAGAFQPDSTCTQIRVGFHVATTSASAYELKIDNFSVDELGSFPGRTIVGSWSTATSYTASTVPAYQSAGWSKSYDTAGGFNTSNGVYTVQELGYYAITALAVLGGGAAGNTMMAFRTNGGGSVLFGAGGSSTSDRVSGEYQIGLLPAGTTIEASVYSSGGSTVSSLLWQLKKIGGVPDQIAQTAQPALLKAVFGSAFTLTTTMQTLTTTTTAAVDNQAGFTPATGLYTVQIPGLYEVTGHVVASSSGAFGINAQLIRNGSTISGSQAFGPPNGTNSTGVIAKTLVLCNAGDTLGVQGSVSTGTQAINTNACYLSVVKAGMNSGLSLLSTDIGCAYRSTAGQSLTSGAVTTVIFGTRIYDTLGGAYNPTTGLFTCQVAGKYLFTSNTGYTYNAIHTKWHGYSKNSTSVFQKKVYTYGYGFSAMVSSNLAWEVDLVVGDVIRCLNYQDSGVTQTFATGIEDVVMSIRKVG